LLRDKRGYDRVAIVLPGNRQQTTLQSNRYSLEADVSCLLGARNITASKQKEVMYAPSLG